MRYRTRNLFTALSHPLIALAMAAISLGWVSLGNEAPAQAQTPGNTPPPGDTPPHVIPVPTTPPHDGKPGLPSFVPQGNTSPFFPKAKAELRLAATMEPERTRIESGMIWRIFGEKEDKEGRLPLLATLSGGTTSINLPSGYYYVHAAFGYAGQTKRIKLHPPFTEAPFSLSAGGLKLNAAFREGDIIPARHLKFEIARLRGETLVPIANDVTAEELVHLPAGPYHIISRYGDINSVASADVKVKSGEVTQLTLFQRGAEITLKLVSELGGEALANTSWTVLTPGGDPVVDTIASAFPSFVLAAGDYVAFARHEDTNYSATFTVQNGVHRDVEILLKPDN